MMTAVNVFLYLLTSDYYIIIRIILMLTVETYHDEKKPMKFKMKALMFF